MGNALKYLGERLLGREYGIAQARVLEALHQSATSGGPVTP
jgi:hypothetical protein